MTPVRHPEKFCNRCGLISFGEAPSGVHHRPSEQMAERHRAALEHHFLECNQSVGDQYTSEFGRKTHWNWVELNAMPEVEAAMMLTGDYEAGYELVIKDLYRFSKRWLP